MHGQAPPPVHPNPTPDAPPTAPVQGHNSTYTTNGHISVITVSPVLMADHLNPPLDGGGGCGGGGGPALVL